MDKAIFVTKDEMMATKAGGTIVLSDGITVTKAMELILVTQEPRTSGELPAYGRGPFVHEGEEHHFVLEGSIVETYDGKEFRLEEGDYFYFQGMRPHSWRNVENEKARIFVVRAPMNASRIHYFDHLTHLDREYAYECMRIHGISPNQRHPDGETTKTPFVVRRGDYKSETVAKTTIDFPTPNVKDQEAELCVQTTGPRARFEYLDGRGPFRHEGEELLYMVSGVMRIRIGEDTRRLTVGDLAYFPGQLQHEFENIGDIPLKCIICESPPITVRPDYYDHLAGEDRDYALESMKKYGITPPWESSNRSP